MAPRFDVNWGGPGYPAYAVEMKVSGGEKTAASQTAQESQYLMNMMKQQFGEQQNLLNNVLVPQLQQMATNPQGFGAQALAAMRSQTIGTIGTQLAEQQKSLQQQFATQNMAGLGSGVQAALGANLAQGAAGAEASNLQQIAIANAQAQQQQQQFGLQGLGQASQLLGQAPQSAGLALTGSQASFNQQYQMAQQGGFWSNLARGALMAAGTAIAGPLGGMAGSALGNLFGPSASSTASNVGATVVPNLGIGSGGSMPDPLSYGGLGIGSGGMIPGPVAPASVPYGA